MVKKFTRVILAILLCSHILTCTASIQAPSSISNTIVTFTSGAICGIVGMYAALVGKEVFSFFKKNRAAKYQDPKSLQFYDYVEARDLKNIEQLCTKNAQSLFGKQFQGEDSAACADNIQARMQSAQENTEKPSWVKLDFHRTYIKTAYCGSEFVGFVMYGWPSYFGTSSGKNFMQGTIDLLVVEEQFRQKGFGHLLLNIAITELQQKGAELIELHTFADNQQAIEFYKKNGFVCVPNPSPEHVTMVRIFATELNELLEAVKAQEGTV